MNIQETITQLFSQNKPIIGLDIGKAEIKMILLEGKTLDNVSIKAYATQSLLIEKKSSEMDKDTLVENKEPGERNESLEEIKRVSTAIKKCWKKLKTNVKDVAIALPSSAIVSRKTTVPKFDTKEELEEKILDEISNTMPFSPEEVNIDFQVIGDSEISPTEQEVLIWATRKEKVEEILAFIDEARLNPVVLDIEHCALHNTLKFIELKENQIPLNISNSNIDDLSNDFRTKSEKALNNINNMNNKRNLSIIIDMGYLNTKMYVYKDYELIYNRETEMGLSSLNNMIMSRFGIENISEVEKLKKSQNLPTEYKLELMPQFLDNYSSEIGRLIDFYFASTASSADNVRAIRLCGGGANLEDIKNYLIEKIPENNLRERILPLSASHYVEKNPSISLSSLQQDDPGLNIAIGLSLRKFIKK